MKLGNAQRFVFTALVVVLALEFGTFTKFQALWNLAFMQNAGSGSTTPAPAQTPPTHSITPNVHPTA